MQRLALAIGILHRTTPEAKTVSSVSYSIPVSGRTPGDDTACVCERSRSQRVIVWGSLTTPVQLIGEQG